MSFQTFVTERLAALTAMLDAISVNAKKIEELPDQEILNPNSLLHLSENGVSKRTSVQKIINSINENTYNQLISINGDISLSGSILTVPVSQWKINGLIYATTSNTNLSISSCATGLSRKDLIVGNNFGQIIRVPGVESSGVVITPSLPLNTVLVAQIDVDDNSIGIGDVLLGIDFRKKLEKKEFIVDAPLANGFVNFEEQKAFRFVTGFSGNVKGIIYNGNFIYDGMEVQFINDTGQDITFVNQYSVSGFEIKLFIKNEEDFILKNLSYACFKYSKYKNRFELITFESSASGEFVPLLGTEENKEVSGPVKFKDYLGNESLSLLPGSENEPSGTLIRGTQEQGIEKTRKNTLEGTEYFDGTNLYKLYFNEKGIFSPIDFSLIDINNLKLFVQRSFVLNNRLQPKIHQITATANQTIFTLPSVAYGDVLFLLGSVPVNIQSISITDNTITYSPASNNNINITAGSIITIYYSELPSSGTSSLWYMADGINSNQVIGVYKAIGASSLENSQINIANPNTNNLTIFNPLYVPEWDSVNGWKFKITYANNLFNPHAFKTGIIPANKNYTVIYSFRDPMNNYTSHWGAISGSNPNNRFFSGYDISSNRLYFVNGVPDDAYIANANTLANTNVVIAVNNNGIYKDGVLVSNMTQSDAVPTEELAIGTINFGADPSGFNGDFRNGYIHAFAIYEGNLTLSQINKISHEMKLIAGVTPSPFYGETIFETDLYETTNPID